MQELIKALPLLRPEFPGCAGDGRRRQRCWPTQQDRAERYGVADLIAGRAFSRPSWPACSAAAEVVVVPSLYEPFGLVALEAQPAGTPVAVADTGGLRELVEPGVTGLRFPAREPGAIAEAVGRPAARTGRGRDDGATARQRATNWFSWPAVRGSRTVAGLPAGAVGLTAASLAAMSASAARVWAPAAAASAGCGSPAPAPRPRPRTAGRSRVTTALAATTDTVADHRSAHHRSLGAEPDVVADPDRRLGDALILDRHRDVGEDVVEVGHVHHVGDDAGATDRMSR